MNIAITATTINKQMSTLTNIPYSDPPGSKSKVLIVSPET